MHCPTACPELDYNYTVRTFDLWLAQRAISGAIDTEYLVGNIVTGNLADDLEHFDAFHQLGTIEEPLIVGIRTAVRLSFTTDNITCRNLEWMLGVDAIWAAGADRLGLDPIIERRVFQVSLEHTMPCGSIIAVRIHRGSIISSLDYLFSPDTVHTLDYELRALPDDSHQFRFGYIEISPAECASS